MAEFKLIPLDKILVPERLRAVEEDHALAIQASIVEHGLINPITVRLTPRAKRPYTLVAGAHRLRAIELLDEAEIESLVVQADADEAQLVEITENLFRNELSALDRAMSVMSYREVWERKFGKVGAGRPGNCANLAQLIEDEAASGFSVHVADRLGLSRRSIENAFRLAKSLQPDLRRKLRGTPAADNQSQLLNLAKMEPARQQKIASAMELGRTLDEAIGDSSDAASAAQRVPMAQKRIGTVVSNFIQLGEPERRSTLRELLERYPDDFRWVVEQLRAGGRALPDQRQISIFDMMGSKP